MLNAKILRLRLVVIQNAEFIVLTMASWDSFGLFGPIEVKIQNGK